MIIHKLFSTLKTSAMLGGPDIVYLYGDIHYLDSVNDTLIASRPSPGESFARLINYSPSIGKFVLMDSGALYYINLEEYLTSNSSIFVDNIDVFGTFPSQIGSQGFNYLLCDSDNNRAVYGTRDSGRVGTITTGIGINWKPGSSEIYYLADDPYMLGKASGSESTLIKRYTGSTYEAGISGSGYVALIVPQYNASNWYVTRELSSVVLRDSDGSVLQTLESSTNLIVDFEFSGTYSGKKYAILYNANPSTGEGQIKLFLTSPTASYTLTDTVSISSSGPHVVNEDPGRKVAWCPPIFRSIPTVVVGNCVYEVNTSTDTLNLINVITSLPSGIYCNPVFLK